MVRVSATSSSIIWTNFSIIRRIPFQIVVACLWSLRKEYIVIVPELALILRAAGRLGRARRLRMEPKG